MERVSEPHSDHGQLDRKTTRGPSKRRAWETEHSTSHIALGIAELVPIQMMVKITEVVAREKKEKGNEKNDHVKKRKNTVSSPWLSGEKRIIYSPPRETSNTRLRRANEYGQVGAGVWRLAPRVASQLKERVHSVSAIPRTAQGEAW